MASVFKRKRDRGRTGSRWVMSYKGRDGKFRHRMGFPDKAASLAFARALEIEEANIRAGNLDPSERTRREAAFEAVEAHVETYRLSLLAKGDTRPHCRQTANALASLLRDARVETVADLAPDRIQDALGRLRAKRSARTANFSVQAVKAFARWLEHSNRIKESPRGIRALRPYPETEHKRVRRALTLGEVARLIRAAESGPDVVLSKPRARVRVVMTGPERAWLYRLAVGTGFRANELRSLTPESFRLDDDPPLVVLKGAYSKHRREDRQPIRADLATALRGWLAGKEPARPVILVPEKTAKLLRHDLKAAGIPERTPEGVIDFHALRSTYVTLLIESGASVKTVQVLARHSSPVLTIGIYAKSQQGAQTAALEGLPGVEEKNG